jgi:hypothetical protein
MDNEGNEYQPETGFLAGTSIPPRGAVEEPNFGVETRLGVHKYMFRRPRLLRFAHDHTVFTNGDEIDKESKDQRSV